MKTAVVPPASVSNPNFGELQIVPVSPNPAGALDRLYLIRGDVTQETPTLSEQIFGPAVGDAGRERSIRILHINDLHHHLVEFDARGDTQRLARIARLVAEARAAAGKDEVVLFVSAGDEHIGTVYDELLGSRVDDFRYSPAYRALSAAGLDAAVVGNHELDKGSALLARAIARDAAFPVLAANLIGSRFDMPWAPAAVGVAKGLRIAFIGVTSTVDIYLQSAEDPGLHGLDPALITGRLARMLGPRVDLLVILSHVGFNGVLAGASEPEYPLAVGDVQIAAAVARATATPGVVVGAHTHTRLNRDELDLRNVVLGVPLLQAGEYGRYLGDARIRLQTDWDGRLQSYFEARLHATGGRDEETEADLDPVLQRAVLDPIQADLDERLNEILGRVEPLSELGRERTRVDRYSGESAIANFMNDAVVARSRYWPGGPVDLAAFNATGLNGVEPSAALTYAQWYEVMPYADEIIIHTLTGAQLEAIVQDNARRIVRPEELIEHGGELDPADFISRGFQHFSSGLRYAIKLGADARQTRAVDITLHGRPISELYDDLFRVAFNTYIAHGRESWNGTAIRGLPADAAPGHDLAALRVRAGWPTRLLYRGQIIDYICDDADGVVGSASGAGKDGRLRVRR